MNHLMWKESNFNWIFCGHVACVCLDIGREKILILKECNGTKILGESPNYGNYNSNPNNPKKKKKFRI